MMDFTDLLIALFAVVFFWVYFINYNIYCIHRNHNKVMEVQIKEKKQVNFYDAEKVKDGIKDRMFINAFLYILSAVVFYSFVEKWIGDNLFFSTGLVFSVVIFLTGMIVKKRVSKKTWSLEYQYIIPKDTEMSKQEKFNKIMSEQEQKNVFIVSAIACALISWPLCSPKVSGMFLAVLVGGVIWFETDIKKTTLEIIGIVISFIKNGYRLLTFLIPTAIIILASWVVKNYIENNHIEYYFYILVWSFIIINFIWGYIIRLETNRKRNLDHEWEKIQKQKNSGRTEKT